MVYLSNSLDSASYYPNYDTLTATDKFENFGKPCGGEIISRDGTPPIRVMLKCISINTRQLWHKHTKKSDQRGFMPKYVYISHIIFYALPPCMASGMHSHTTWKMYTSTGHQATSDNLKMDESSSNVDTRNEKNHWLVHETYGIGKMTPKPVTVDITKKDMLATRMNHRQTAIIKKWIKVIRDPVTRKTLKQDDLPEKVRLLLDENLYQEVIPVFEHTNYSLKKRMESEYHNDDNLMQILTNHQLGNLEPKLTTQKSKPEGMKTDKFTESSVDKSASWKKSEYIDWGQNSWSSQSWDTNSYTRGWVNKNKGWNDKYVADSKNTNKKQKTTSDNEKKEREWRHRQAVAYTTHYRGILTAIMPFPAWYYGINKGKYTSPEQGQHCDPTTVYPIPTGEHMEFGRTHPAMASFSHPLNPDYPLGPDSPDHHDEITPMLWDVYRKKQEEEQQQNTKANFENKIAARRQEMEMEALAKTKKESITNHGGTTKALDKRGNYIVGIEGGLPLTCFTDDHVHVPDEDDRSSLAYKSNENKKTIKNKPEKSNTVEDRSSDMQLESDKKDEVPTEQQRLSELQNAMEYLAKDNDPITEKVLQHMLDMVNIIKTNKSNPAAPSSSTAPDAAAPDDIKTENEEAADPGITKVDIEESSDEESEDHAF
jgi:hypothetical protein